MIPANRPSLHRVLIAPLALSALMILSAVVARAPIVDALTQAPVRGVRLETPAWYRVLAPVSNVFDALTLLSVRQIISTFLFVLAVATIARFRRPPSQSGSFLFRLRGNVRFFATVAGGFVAIAGLALLATRPMASIRADDGALVAVDFHSHTSASHDGRPNFTPERNREWHRRAGFDVAYVTDHHTFAGANSAMRSNPASGAAGVVLLPGLEYRDEDEHVIAIGLDPERTNAERREWHPLAESERGRSNFSVPAVLILSLPGDVDRIPADEEIGIARLSAIELSDGSPRGLQQGASNFSAIRTLAVTRHLAVVSGSDNHGWGSTAAAWTFLRIPSWRAMSPNELDAAIRKTLLAGGNDAAVVVTRRVPAQASALSVALTAPEIALEIARDIGWEERLSWMFWAWTLALTVVLVRRRRSAESAVREPVQGRLSGGAPWTIPAVQNFSSTEAGI